LVKVLGAQDDLTVWEGPGKQKQRGGSYSPADQERFCGFFGEAPGLAERAEEIQLSFRVRDKPTGARAGFLDHQANRTSLGVGVEDSEGAAQESLSCWWQGGFHELAWLDPGCDLRGPI
jgi:hypothetical protein